MQVEQLILADIQTAKAFHHDCRNVEKIAFSSIFRNDRLSIESTLQPFSSHEKLFMWYQSVGVVNLIETTTGFLSHHIWNKYGRNKRDVKIGKNE